MALVRTYTIVLDHREGGGYAVRVPALPGCAAEGASLAAAILHARTVIARHLDALSDQFQPIPDDCTRVELDVSALREAYVTRVTVAFSDDEDDLAATTP